MIRFVPGMSVFLKNISFHGILLDAVTEENGSLFQDILHVLKDGIKSGFVRPLQATVFDHADVEKAFRYMTTGRHVGKVLVKVHML